MGMVINSSKSLMISWGLSEHEKHYLNQIFPFVNSDFEASLKHLGFHLNYNLYLKGILTNTYIQDRKKNEHLAQQMAIT
jgi:hypothetical protein